MFYRIRRVWLAARKALKMPMGHLHSYDWGPMDHKHICLAARLLEPDDFKDVCPFDGEPFIEFEDCCDECEYFAIIDFNSEPHGEKKYINIYTYTRGGNCQL